MEQEPLLNQAVQHGRGRREGKHSKLPSPKSDIFSRQASAVYLLTKHAEGWGSVRRKTCFDGNPGCGITAGGRRRHSIGVAAGALAIALVTALPMQGASASQVSMATAASFGQLAGAGRAAGSAAGPADVAVLDVVMLVDESGSETPAKVADEKQTAGTIVQTMLNPHSRVTVVGFGGVNHLAPNQNPGHRGCQPTIASGATHPGLPAARAYK